MLTMFDASLDQTREITQADVDRLVDAGAISWRFRNGLKALERACHAALRGEMSIEDYRKLIDVVEQLAPKVGR